MPPGDAGYCRHQPAQRRALLTVRRMYAARREGLVSRDRYAQKRPLLGRCGMSPLRWDAKDARRLERGRKPPPIGQVSGKQLRF